MGFFSSMRGRVGSLFAGNEFETYRATDINPKFKEFKDLSRDEDDALKQSVLENAALQNYDKQDTYMGDTSVRAYTDFVYGSVATSKPMRLQNYRRMAQFPEVGDAIDEICDSAINYDENNKLIHLKFKEEVENKVKVTEINDQFSKYISLFDLDEQMYDYLRMLVIEGQLAWENIVDKDNKDLGIIGVNFIPTESYDFLVNMKGEKKGICVSEAAAINNRTVGAGSQIGPQGGIQMQTAEDFMRSKEQNKNRDSQQDTGENITVNEMKGVPLPWEQLTYCDSGSYNPNKLIVYPVLERARKAFRQLSLIEDIIIIYRLARAPVRMVFSVDTGEMNKNKAEQEVLKLMKRYQTKQFYNPETGSVSNDYNPHSILDNFFFPKPANGVGGTTVTTLDTGGQALWTSLPDLEYFLKKLYRSLKVPFKRYSEPAVEVNKGQTISYEEYKFSKFVMRILDRMSAGFKWGFKQHLKLTGLWEQYDLDDHDFTIKFTPPTIFDLYEQQKLIKVKYENYDTVIREHPEISKRMAMKKCLGWSDKEIDQNFKDVQEEAMLMAIVERKAETLKGGANPYVGQPTEKQ